MRQPTSNLENDQDLSLKDEESSDTLNFVWFILLLIGCDWGYLSRGLSI